MGASPPVSVPAERRAAMNTEGLEPGPYEPVPDDLILAAIERAIRHGDGKDVWVVGVEEHLGFERTPHNTRRLREQLNRLRAQPELLVCEERLGREYWRLGPTGESHLAKARATGRVGELPESPQHRRWRVAQAAATERIEAFRLLLNRVVDETASAEADALTPSAAWFALGRRLSAATWLVGSATYCRDEWVEPSDDCNDSEPNHYSSPSRRAVWTWDGQEAIAKGDTP
jgi:hypothetical protein